MHRSDEIDADTLLGHYLIAGLDGRLDDQRHIGTQLIQRGQMSETIHDALMQQSAERTPLVRPIIAGPDN